MKTVLILSGGMDSGTLLFDLLDQGHEVRTVSFNYGQRHGIELQSARLLSEAAKVENIVLDLSGLKPWLFSGSSQTDDKVEVPHGHYAEENMKKTVVPNRNMIMLSLAAARAISMDFEALAYGAHGGDHAIYPNCRPQFVGAMSAALYLADWKNLALLAPYSYMNKISILKRGLALKVPYENTWTCYDPKPAEKVVDELAHGWLACGKCGSCQERLEAFKLNGVTDPLEYVHV